MDERDKAEVSMRDLVVAAKEVVTAETDPDGYVAKKNLERVIAKLEEA